MRTVAFVSLGCPKNLVDSEKMLGLLAEDGLIPVSDEATADAIVINTCGFLEASKIESIDEINRAAQLKKKGNCQRIVVAGCLVQRHRAKMLEWCPDIDAMIGVFDRDRVVEAVTGSAPATNVFEAQGPNFVYVKERLRKDYYMRWMLKPSRLQQNTRMPQFANDEGLTPFADLFEGSARQQFGAVWEYLLGGREIKP